MGVNSLPKTVTRQRRGCDLNPGPSAPESSTLSTRLPSIKWSVASSPHFTIRVSEVASISLMPEITWKACGRGTQPITASFDQTQPTIVAKNSTQFDPTQPNQTHSMYVYICMHRCKNVEEKNLKNVKIVYRREYFLNVIKTFVICQCKIS